MKKIYFLLIALFVSFVAEAAAPATTMYLYYKPNYYENWDLAGCKKPATHSNNVYTWNQNFENGDYVTFSTGNATSWNDWNSVNGTGRYGNSNSNYSIDENTINTEISLINNTQNSLLIKKAGNYTITLDFTTSTPKVTFTLHMYMYYKPASYGGWDLVRCQDDATPDNKVYSWKRTFTKGDEVFFCSKSTGNQDDWDWLKDSRYGPSSNNTKITSTTTSAYTLSNNENSFLIDEAGEYTIAMDFTGSSPKVTFKTAAAEKLTSPRITVDNQQPNKPGSNVYYYLVNIETVDTHNGVRTYYTINGTTPSENSNVVTAGRKIQVPAGHTVRAINIATGFENSDVVPKTVGGSTTFKYSWESADPNARSSYMRVKITKNKTDNQMLLSADVTQTNTNIDYGTANDSEFSWAKYFDAEESAELAAKDPKFYAENSDHIEGTLPEVSAAYTPDVQENRTDCHIPRNFTEAHYRVYVHSDNEPTPVGQVRSGKPSRVKTLAESPAKWSPNDGTAAGNVDPTATTRVAYTVAVPLNQTTGVEDIVSDRVGEEEDTDAPVYYYNLQGVRVQNPEHGIYIRVQGKKATKHYIR